MNDENSTKNRASRIPHRKKTRRGLIEINRGNLVKLIKEFSGQISSFACNPEMLVSSAS
jgi:hypothetical protein